MLKTIFQRKFTQKTNKTPQGRPLLNSGLTLIELLVVLTLLAVVLIGIIFSIQRYLLAARDSERKSHLEKYRVAFEEYYNDKGRFPTQEMLEDCGSEVLKPYINQIYCDPTSGEPYYYQVSSSGTAYFVYTNLLLEDDQVIAERGCQNGCGPDLNSDGSGDFNYGISSGQAVIGTPVDEQTPTVTPTCGSHDAPFCFAGICSECCPSSTYRCSETGNECILDLTCGS